MNEKTKEEFDAFFERATGQTPFPYQRRLAIAGQWPARIEVPTGLGKTLAVVVGWLWRRRHPETFPGTPRRLVYCLPMRVLVEQTRDVVRDVLARLESQASVVVLLGGVDDGGEWDTRPEDDAVIIGTQDMLLSRALNRGYGMSRFRWPLHFGLLNNDALWVIDEVQLVGVGVATTAQLQALRRTLGTSLPTATSWMSATLEQNWLRTVDVEEVDVAARVALDATDEAHPVVSRRVRAAKPVRRSGACMGDAKAVASDVVASHRAATRTLVVVNTVDRAREIFVHLRKMKTAASLVLIHSRFRSAERADALGRALAPPSEHGTIVVSTQVVEAGVDMTSSTLFTELAPWASLVQRFGRCNRRGEDEGAVVAWIDLPSDEKARAKLERPYALDELLAARESMLALADAGPGALPRNALGLDAGLVLRRRDLVDLFDTSPDLSGHDVDVSRFIRETDEHDVRVFWRDIEEPSHDEPSPTRDELCAAPIATIRGWLAQTPSRSMWTWDALRGRWARVDRVYAGMSILLRARDGGYDTVLGLDPKGTALVPPVVVAARAPEPDREYDGEPESEWRQWYTLRRHSCDVAAEAAALADAVGLDEAHARALVDAGRWHDSGKAHPVWQAAARRLGDEPPAEHVAKSLAQRGRIVYEGRPGFRHELASALLALTHGQSDLVAYLVACHHGKVRLSIRSLPTERAPVSADGREDRAIRYARGVWEGDSVPEVDLGDGIVVPPTTLTLRYMELGEDEVTGPSWLARALALRDDPAIGPFRLGFLEALVKCADERASRRVSEAGGRR